MAPKTVWAGDNSYWYPIWSPHDAMIVPAEAASIEPLGKDAIVENCGHLSLLLSSRVAELVAGALAGDRAR